MPLSPYSFGNGTSVEYNLTSSGYLYVNVLMSNGVRPSISIAPSVKIAPGGDGTAEAPYEFVVE